MVSHRVESSQVILDKSARVHNQIFSLDRHRESFCKKEKIIFCLKVQYLNQELNVFWSHSPLGEKVPL